MFIKWFYGFLLKIFYCQKLCDFFIEELEKIELGLEKIGKNRIGKNRKNRIFLVIFLVNFTNYINSVITCKISCLNNLLKLEILFKQQFNTK